MGCAETVELIENLVGSRLAGQWNSLLDQLQILHGKLQCYGGLVWECNVMGGFIRDQIQESIVQYKLLSRPS